MSEAKQLYDDILSALSPILPRTVYQDVRRVRTLACASRTACASLGGQRWPKAGPTTPHAGSDASHAGCITLRLSLPNGIGL